MSADFDIQVNNSQSSYSVDCRRLCSAAKKVLQGEGISKATISLAVVDDPEIQRLNVEHLDHDYATDVLSFLFSDSHDFLDGEVIVSAETAARQASSYNWSMDDELLLYIVHGMLHLVGYDDTTDDARGRMREMERHYLVSWDLVPRYDNLSSDSSESMPESSTFPKKGEANQ